MQEHNDAIKMFDHAKKERTLPFPTMWDRAVSKNKRGKAKIVLRGDGRPKKPLFTKKGGGTSLYAINEGDVVVEVTRKGYINEIFLRGVRDITRHGNEFVVSWHTIARSYNGFLREEDDTIWTYYESQVGRALSMAGN